MRRYCVLFFLVLTQSIFSQVEWGAKLGAAFPSDTKLLKLFEEDNRLEAIENKISNMQIGLYSQIELASVFVRPELHFASARLKFKDFDYTQGNLEMPISVGFKIVPLLSVFAGPSIKFSLTEKIKNSAFFEEAKKESTIVLHLGTRFHLGALGVGLRYERAFKQNEIKLIKNNVPLPFGSFDNRPKQLILDLAFRF